MSVVRQRYYHLRLELKEEVKQVNIHRSAIVTQAEQRLLQAKCKVKKDTQIIYLTLF